MSEAAIHPKAEKVTVISAETCGGTARFIDHICDPSGESHLSNFRLPCGFPFTLSGSMVKCE